MDEMALRRALAMLRSFADNLPTSDTTIDERYVNLFHATLADIARETGHNLDYFHVPESEITKRWTGSQGTENFYTKTRKVDREMLLIKLNGSLNFIASLLEAPGKRIIGFV